MTIQTYPAPKSQVTSSFWRYTATGGETTLTGIDNAGVNLAYLPGQEQVYLNGIMLMRGTDYTATNGTSIVGLSPLTASDYIQVITYSNFTVTNIPVGSISGAITNLQLANSTITIGSTLINLGDTKNTIAGLTLTSPTINNPIVGTQYSTSVPLTVKGAAGQAVSLQEWQDSSNNKLVVIDPSGKVGIGTASPNRTLNLTYPNATIGISNTSVGGGSMSIDAPSNGFAQIDVAGANDIRINTNGSERMRINSSGNIGIGTINPGFGLEVANNVSFGTSNSLPAGGFAIFAKSTANWNYSQLALFRNASNTTTTKIIEFLLDGDSLANTNLQATWNFGLNTAANPTTGTVSSNTTHLFLGGPGNFLIGYTSSNGAYKLQVNSQIFATSSSIATSDAKFKENVDTINNGLKMIDALNPVAFNWKKHDKHNFVEGKTVGFIAQEVREALKDYEWIDNIVKENKNEETGEEFLGLAETHIIPLLVSAVKELSAKVKALEAK